jgi:outer membrane protein assembly factor BamE (lipoprotein component of BamABCDE complex)
MATELISCGAEAAYKMPRPMPSSSRRKLVASVVWMGLLVGCATVPDAPQQPGAAVSPSSNPYSVPRLVLTVHDLARVVPGLTPDQVLGLLGQPIAITPYSRLRQTHYDWRYRDGPNQSDSKLFTVIFDAQMRVASTQSMRDPALDPVLTPPFGLLEQSPGLGSGAVPRAFRGVLR